MATNEPDPPTANVAITNKLEHTVAFLEKHGRTLPITLELRPAEVAALNRVLTLNTAQAECEAAGADRHRLLVKILAAIGAAVTGLMSDERKELLEDGVPGELGELELELEDGPGREDHDPIAAVGTLIGAGDRWRWFARSGPLELQARTELPRAEAKRRGQRVSELLKRARRIAEAP